MRSLLFFAIMIVLAVVAFQQVKNINRTVPSPEGRVGVTGLPSKVGADAEAAAAERAKKLREAIERQQ